MRGSWDRLGASDRTYLALETAETPMHIAALGTLEGAPALDGARDRLELRTRAVPALRRVLYRPGPPFGPPLWVDDQDFAIERHVHEARIAAPGGEDEVLRAAEDLVARRLDRSRPLWELWLLTGLPSGRAAVLLKLHHAVADGLAAIEILGALFDLSPDAPDPSTATPAPQRAPGRRALLRENALRKGAACRGLARAIARPGRLVEVARTARRGVAEASLNPVRTSLNRPVGRGRRLAVVRLGLEEARVLAHAHGATVNDVVLTLAAGGLRDLLRGRGEPLAGVALHVSVAHTVRPAGETGALGNRVGALMVPLPVGELDAEAALEAVAASTRRAKTRQVATTTEGLMVWMTNIRPFRAWYRHQHLVNVFETDLQGPPAALYLLGARVLDLMPITALSGNVTMTFTALSYAGGLAITVCADAAQAPDLELLRSGMQRTWELLWSSHAARAGESRPLRG